MNAANKPRGGYAPIDRLVRPFEVFAHNKVAGAILLMVATALALFLANSPWSDSYRDVLEVHAKLGIGTLVIDKPLLLWINDGLMAVFFFVVGLEIKREILTGELSTPRKAALPVAAAVGGMLVPAGAYLLLNTNGDGTPGWGIPMATDIAFALGVLLLIGPRAPLALKVFLTALAIVDDIGAIVVIAVFYTESIAIGSLAVGLVMFLMSILSNRLGIRNPLFYFALGFVAWVGFLKSGVHATLAAVLMAMTIPSRTRIDAEPLIDRLRGLLDKFRADPQGSRGILSDDQQDTLQRMQRDLDDATAPLQELEHALMPLVTFVVMPVFALANAGVEIGSGLVDAFSDPVCLGIVAGLFLGKQAGIFGAAWLAVKIGIAELPSRVTWRQLHAVSVLGGIGFTMSLFVASLAFPGSGLQDVAKVGILSASLVSALVGAGLVLSASPAPSADSAE